ncbi:MMPL family transporter [Kocuria rhizophila]|nr:MMPL family transporter [Kocuria rhizophila]
MASGRSTVIAGLLCLLSRSSPPTAGWAPATAIGVVFAYLAGLTLLPALLLIFGRIARGPGTPRVDEHPRRTSRPWTPLPPGLWPCCGPTGGPEVTVVWIVCTVLLA